MFIMDPMWREMITLSVIFITNKDTTYAGGAPGLATKLHAERGRVAPSSTRRPWFSLHVTMRRKQGSVGCFV